MQTRPIALLTDFGDLDAYVGAMKGVLLSLARHAPIVDITHQVPPGDIRRAALLLWQAAPYFPPGTVFLAVVDPGVGTPRRALAVEFNGFACVGPDNGLFTYLLATRSDWRAVALQAETLGLPEPSWTFHGRDVLAPAAARLAVGQTLASLGRPAGDLVRFPLPRCELESETTIVGEIIAGDAFGNAVTSVGILHREGEQLAFEPWLPGSVPARLALAGSQVIVGGLILDLVTTFGAVAPGESLAYIGSSGLLEIGVNQGRAVDQLDLAPGQAVRLSSARRTQR